MQTRDAMRDRSHAEALTRRAAQGQAAPTAAMARLTARARGRTPATAAPATETLLEGAGPLQKPLVR